MLLTGKNMYRYFKLNSNFQLQPTHDRLIKKDLPVSNDYSCHAWIDRRIIICSTRGDIFLVEMSGEFKMLLTSAPGPSFNI